MSTLLALDAKHYEEVVRWRQRVGSQLAGIWERSGHNETAHIVVIFGNARSNRPLATPLWQSVAEDHELDDDALELWEQMWQVPHPQIADFTARRHDMRAVIVSSRPVNRGILRLMLDCIRDNVADDLPDHLLTA